MISLSALSGSVSSSIRLPEFVEHLEISCCDRELPSHNAQEDPTNQSKPDFISKMNIALKEERRETLYWLRLVAASELLTERQLTAMIQEANEMAETLGAIVRSARRNREGS